MLSDLPQFFLYGGVFLAPTLLRLGAAAIFAYAAAAHLRRRGELAKVSFPIVGSGMWIVIFGVLVEGALALALLLGWHTQVAAIVGMIAAAKYFFLNKHWRPYFFLPRTTTVLLFVILASLVLSGAGAFAYNIPL